MNCFLKKNIFALFVFFLLAVFVTTKDTLAAVTCPTAGDPWERLSGCFQSKGTALFDSFCRPTQSMFNAIAEDQPQQSIVRFGYNYDTVRYLKLTYNIFGMSMDNIIRCLPVVGVACGLASGTPIPACDGLLKGFGYNQQDRDSFASSPVSGSLMGLFYRAQYLKDNIGSPFDVRYFASREFEGIPFLGTALAAGPTYTAPFITETYEIWKFVRNLSLAALSLIMLVIGIMMINRSKINPQTVVTIQYALPKLIIAVILIVFSYPIGATLANFFWYLPGGINSLVALQLKNTIPPLLGQLWNTTWNQPNIGSSIIFLFTTLLSQATLVAVTLVVGLLVAIVAIIQYIIIVIKFFICYAKIAFEIVMSPGVFVLSAIPGNDDRVSGWFKKVLAYGLSMAVLTAGANLVFTLGLLVITSAFLSTNTIPGIPVNFGVMGLNIVAPIEMAVIIILGLSIVIKMPAMIEEALVGKPKRK